MYEPYQHEINSAVRVQTCSYPAGTHEDALFIHIQFNQQLFHCLTHKQTQKRYLLTDMMLNKKGSCCHVPSDLSLIVADKHWSVTFHDWRSKSLEMTPEIPQSHVLWITCRQTWPQIDFLICIRNIWKKGENIYIYRYVCVSLCVKKTHSGGLDPSSFTLSLSYDPISQVSHSRTQHLQRTCCSWGLVPKNNSCVGIMTSPPDVMSGFVFTLSVSSCDRSCFFQISEYQAASCFAINLYVGCHRFQIIVQ